jgi:undecaprenyl-phosphate galactose phosphotransferase
MSSLDRHSFLVATMPEMIKIRHFPVKRLFDILFSLSALFFLSPLFLILTLLIRLTSRGPAIYAHKRVGRGAKPFYCYKFRSMFCDADQRLETLLSNDPALKEEWRASQKLKSDPRITKVGTFLRKSSLDELPQFMNVLTGDLSVVGPRAMVESEIKEHLGNHASKILSIRPGVTGLWQISGRSDTSYPRRIQLDLEYINSHNFFTDLKIIAKTIPVMLFSKGAY